MDTLFAWYNIMFYIPTLFGMILVMGSAFGLIGDGDVDSEMDNEADSTMLKALSVLGIGKVPVTIVLMMASLIFGGVGISMNFILEDIIGNPMVYSWISIATAFTAMVVLTNRSARIIARYMPTTETYSISRYGFSGQTGVLIVATDEKSGTAQVRDHEGNVHNVQCRTSEGGETLKKGTQVLVIDYDPTNQVCIVTKNPVSNDL